MDKHIKIMKSKSFISTNNLLFWGLFCIKILLFFYLFDKPLNLEVISFLDFSVERNLFDPWKNWTNNGGAITAFPYGYAMLFVFYPLFKLNDLLALSAVSAYCLSLLIIDLMFFYIVKKFVSNDKYSIIYWISPIVVISTYILGANDLIPMFFLALSLFFLKNNKFYVASLFLILAASAKIFILLLIPFYFIYFKNSPNLRFFLIRFILASMCFLLLFFAPYLMSTSALEMLKVNDGINFINLAKVTLGGGTDILIIPLLYATYLYIHWKQKYSDFDLTVNLIGFFLIMIVLIFPFTPGWYLWIYPFLIFFYTQDQKTSFLLSLALNGLFALDLLNKNYILGLNLNSLMPDFFQYIHTILFCASFFLIFKLFRNLVLRNVFFKLNQKPFVISIAGDSGSGKDYLVILLIGLLGKENVSHISGDNYHLWDRPKANWKVFTPLNPLGNDLEKFSQDVLDLYNGKNITQKVYDHSTGKFINEKKVLSNRILIVSGLHSLYLSQIRAISNLKIFLDMDQKLKNNLKFSRDLKSRGHTLKSIKEAMLHRKKDYLEFILPQKGFANIIFSLSSANSKNIKRHKNTKDNFFNLKVNLMSVRNESQLLRTLISLCELEMTKIGNSSTSFHYKIRGNPSSLMVSTSSHRLLPKLNSFLTHNPSWKDGNDGIFQLIVLNEIYSSIFAL
jgi:uridine kinase